MSNRNIQPTLAGQLPSQQSMTQLLTQVDFASDNQLPLTRNLSSQTDSNAHNKLTKMIQQWIAHQMILYF